MGPHDVSVNQSISYTRLQKSQSEKFDTSDDINLVAPPSPPFGVITTLKESFRSLDSCPKEIWINFILKFFESYSYFAISQILVIYLHTEFGVGDIEAGTAYGTWGLAITVWGLLTAWINDNLGVRKSLLVGFSISAVGYLLLATATSKIQVYITLFGVLPIGNAMGIPMLTVGIRRYTNIMNRGFAFGLFYAVMNVAAFLSGPVVDIFNIYLNHDRGIMIFDRVWSGNRLVILTGVCTSICSLTITFFNLREIKVVDLSPSTSTSQSSTPLSDSSSPFSTIPPGNKAHKKNDNVNIDTSMDKDMDIIYKEAQQYSPSDTLSNNNHVHNPINTNMDIICKEAQQYSPLDSISKVDYLEFQITPPLSSEKVDMIDNSLNDRLIKTNFNNEVPNTLNKTNFQNKNDREHSDISRSNGEIKRANNNYYEHNREKSDDLDTMGDDNDNDKRHRGDSELELLPYKDNTHGHTCIDISKKSYDRDNSKKIHDENHFTIETDDNDEYIDSNIRIPKDIHNTNDNINNVNTSTEVFQVQSQSPYQSTKELFMSKTFWRFTFFTLFLINLKTIFRHLDATLPTYLIRTFGENVPKGLIYSINPFMIIFLTPVVAALTSKYAHYDMIKWGSYLTALSPFFLAFSTSIWASCCMTIVLSLGEAVWSPRTYDYTMSIAPEGREASFAAMSAAPIFAAKIPVGLMSGYLVAKYLPEHGKQDGKTLWLIIALTTLISPIGITVFESCIREPSPAIFEPPKDQEDEEAQRYTP